MMTMMGVIVGVVDAAARAAAASRGTVVARRRHTMLSSHARASISYIGFHLFSRAARIQSEINSMLKTPRAIEFVIKLCASSVSMSR